MEIIKAADFIKIYDESPDCIRIKTTPFTVKDHANRYLSVSMTNGDGTPVYVQLPELVCIVKPKSKDDEGNDLYKSTVVLADDGENGRVTKEYFERLNKSMFEALKDNVFNWFPSMSEKRELKDMEPHIFEDEIKSMIRSPLTFSKIKENDKYTDKFNFDKYYFKFKIPYNNNDRSFGFPLVDDDNNPYPYESIDDLERCYITFILQTKSAFLTKDQDVDAFAGFMINPMKARIVPKALTQRNNNAGMSFDEMMSINNAN